MIYKVRVKAPAVDEEVTTTADNEQEAKERAVTSAIQRQFASNNASVEVTPQTGEPPPPEKPAPPPEKPAPPPERSTSRSRSE